jgi:hypothetical protein
MTRSPLTTRGIEEAWRMMMYIDWNIACLMSQLHEVTQSADI